MSKLVSIIAPVYNAEKYLEKCINSILNQTYSCIEVILVDDGSQDRSGEICDRFAAEDARITVIHQINMGVSAARNIGVQKARGDYLAFIDGDDYILPQMIEKMLCRIEEDKSEMAICGFIRVDEKGKELSTVSISSALVTGPEAVSLHYKNTRGIMPIPVNKLYQKQLFDSVLFPEGKRHEDEATFYRFMDQCKRVSILSEPLYCYVQHVNSYMSGTYTVVRLDGVEASFERYRFYREKKERYKKLLQPEGKAFLWLFYDAVRHFQPETEQEKERVHEICRMAREMCDQPDVHWTLREKVKLCYPKIYMTARKLKDRLCRMNGIRSFENNKV